MNNINSNTPVYNLPFQPEDDGPGLKRYLSLFMSNWYWFAFTLFVALSLSYGINRYSGRLYTVSSLLLIKDEQKSGGVPSPESFISSADIFRSQQNIQNEIGILKSFSLNLRVIDSLPDFHIVYVGIGRRNIVEKKLYKEDCPVEVHSDFIDLQPVGVPVHIELNSNNSYKLEINGGSKINTVLEFGQRFKENGFDFIIKLRHPESFEYHSGNSNRFYFYFTSPEGMANSYRSKLNVNPIDKDATLMSLSVSGFVPEQESDYLNKLMEIYIKQGLEFKNRTADSTIAFINRQLDLVSRSLYIAEDSLQKFRYSYKLIDLSKEGTLIQSRLERFDNEKITLELQKKYYEYLVEYLDSKNESGDIISPSIMGVTDQLLGQLVKELADLQLQKKQLAMNFSGELPPLNLLEENINTARKTLSENVKNSLNNIKLSILDNTDRINLTGEEISKLPGTERKLLGIQRTFDINNTVFTFLREKRSEAGIAKASNVSDNRIIDKAYVFNSMLIKPQMRRNNMLALFLGFLIPMVLIYLLYYFNNKIIDRKDIEKGTRAPIIGYISHNDNTNEIPVIDKPGSTLAESFRSVRTAMKYFINEAEHPVISITSTISSEGKTFISLNLAAITSMLGKKVLLIGLDLRKPRIDKIFYTGNNLGMSTYLSGNCEYDDVIQSTSITNLYYASSGPVPPNPAELIENVRMKTFIENAKKEYDYIIIDTPPIAVVSDALLLSGLADINLFVVRQRYSSKNTLELIQEYYQDRKLKNMGIIINDISLSGYYGYGLRYGYSMGYGYSYGNRYYGKYVYSRYGYSDKTKEYYTEE